MKKNKYVPINKLLDLYLNTQKIEDYNYTLLENTNFIVNSDSNRLLFVLGKNIGTVSFLDYGVNPIYILEKWYATGYNFWTTRDFIPLNHLSEATQLLIETQLEINKVYES